MSGPFAIYGEEQQKGAELAKDELNEAGGILGRQVELVYADTTSDVEGGVEQARALLGSEDPDVVIGIISSAVRDAVVPIFAREEKILIYPTTYEGGAATTHEGQGARYLFTTGPVPEQYVKPLVTSLVEDHGHETFYNLGADYIYGTGSIAAAKEAIEAAGGEVIEEELIPLGTSDFSGVLNRVEAAEPDAIFAVIAGDDLNFLLEQYHEFGLREDGIAFTTSELDESYLEGLGAEVVDGIVSSYPYFMALDTPENEEFVESMRERHGEDALTNLASQSEYYSIKLFAIAAEEAGSLETEALIGALEGASIQAPQGKVTIRPEDHQAIMSAVIASVNPKPGEPPDTWFEIQEIRPEVEPPIQGNAQD